MKGKCLFLFALALLIKCCFPARILVLSPISSKSHKISLMPVVAALAHRGHLVTILTSHPPEEEVDNVKEIVVHNPYINDGKFNWFAMNSGNPLLSHFMIFYNFATMSKLNYESMMNNTEFQSILEGHQVDLVILDDSFNDFCLKVVDDLKVPFVYFSTSTGYPWVFKAMGASQELSTVPSRFTGYDNNMSFKERLFNTLAGIATQILRNFMVIPAIDAYTKEDFPTARSISEIEKEASLYFISSHWVSTWPRPLPPTVISLGPLHIHPPKLLPQELQLVVNDSGNDGFILFTLGSIKSSKFMPTKYVETFIKVFSKIPQRVIWKWDDPNQKPANIPANVWMVDWLPQQDLLGQPKIRLFITHGGLLGMQESLYNSVPLIALPFGSDQYLNAAKMKYEGCGLRLDWENLDEPTLYNAITTVIRDPSYKKNASRVSRMMRNELVKGTDVAVYWIDHVLRFNGTKHLKLASQSIPFYQVYLLDVGLFLASISLFFIYFTSISVRYLMRRPTQQISIRKKTA